MSKYTKCFSTMKILLEIGIDNEPEYEAFLKNYFEIGSLDSSEGRCPFDPRKSSLIIREFEHLLDEVEFGNIMKDFKLRVRNLLSDALNQQDTNTHTPLHIASYFGDFKSSRLMVELGAKSTAKHFNERPLEISKDKFSRDVLQNLNDAASEANFEDLRYLVNCGEIIDDRMSITGEAPIHKAVLSD